MTDEDMTNDASDADQDGGAAVGVAGEGALRAAEVWTDPPVGLFDRIAGELGIVPSAPGAGASAARPRPARRFRWQPMVAAAAAAALFGTGFVVGGLGDESGEAAEPEPVAELTLTGTELAPEAVADVDVFDRGAGYALILDTRNLAPAPDGRFYQGWLRSREGQEISVGTFHMRGGDDTVVLWSGVSIDLYPTLVITLNGADLIPGPSPAEAVMIGELPTV